MLVLQDIYLHPIKSTRSLRVEEASVLPRGLRFDRRWMLVEPDGRMITQREEPRLVLARVGVDGERFVLEADGHAPLRIPAEPEAGGERRPVQIWKDTVEAEEPSPEASAWFGRFLGRPCRLIYMPPAVRRAVDPAYAAEGDVVSFADGFPLLLIGTASLADLNARLAEPVPMTRFRPNLVVDGAAPFAEDGWREIRVGDVRLHVVKPCARCVVTTVDGETATPGKEPLRTLAGYRNRGGKVLFGMNAIPAGQGTIRAGDPVEVLA